MNKYLLNEEPIVDILSNNKIVIIDGGARGQLFPPFKYINKKILQILRFDPETGTDIEGYTDNDMVFRKALWHSRDRIKLNIAESPPASSVYPFNRKLQKYIDPFVDLRKTKEIVEVDTISLDDIINDHPQLTIDFVKLDIHGAEFDVLQGGREVLKTSLGLLIESWILPIHKGQKTRAHVEALAFDNQFYVFEENHLGKWARLGDRFSKRQSVPIDTLFFKDPLLDENVTEQGGALKLIGIANLFGHNAFALQLTQYFYDSNILEEKYCHLITSFINKYGTKTLKDRIADKAQKISDMLSSCAFKQ